MGEKTSLGELLEERKGAVRQKWLDAIVESYPPETARFLRAKKDQIANPVGHTITEMVADVLDSLVFKPDLESLPRQVFPFVQVRAVQGFAPSEALNYVFALRGILKAEAARAAKERKTDAAGVAGEIEEAVDTLAKVAFDAYMDCRERLFEVKAEELKRNMFMLLKDNGMIDVVEG